MNAVVTTVDPNVAIGAITAALRSWGLAELADVWVNQPHRREWVAERAWRHTRAADLDSTGRMTLATLLVVALFAPTTNGEGR